MLETVSTAMSIANKIEKLYHLLELLHWDEETKTLTIDSSINIKIKGDYQMEADRHLAIKSNFLENDPMLEIPYSVFINSDELEFKRLKEEARKLAE